MNGAPHVTWGTRHRCARRAGSPGVSGTKIYRLERAVFWGGLAGFIFLG